MMKVLSKIYSAVSHARNFLYDANLLDNVELGPPVISVGNLSMGGTGKTPVVELLLRELKGRGLKPLVVSRNYKARGRYIESVELEKPQAAQWFGDEPTLLKSRHPDVPVYVGPVKALTAQLASKKESEVDVVIIDDGFQHRGLNRRFDIVLMDASVPASDYQIVPLGRLREGFSSLKRADLVILTKVNLATAEHVEWLKAQIPSSCEVLELRFLTGISSDLLEGSRIGTLAGIAQPNTFFNQVYRLAESQKCEMAFSMPFPDHYFFTEFDVKRIEDKMKETGATHLVVTEKDFVKLENFSFNFPVLQAHLELEWVNPPQADRGLYGFFDQLTRH